MPIFKRCHRKSQVVVIGLDCLEPQLAFEQFADKMPNLTRLRKQGAYGQLESVIPPITVPAWASMTTGKHPGALGIYGFRNRLDTSYDRLAIVTSQHIKEKAVWDYLTEADKTSVLIGIPPGYPPKPLKGQAVSCFLTPSGQNQFTYPTSLREELQQLVGEYLFDVKNFRTDDKAWLLDQIYQLTRQRFAVATHLLTTRDWDFFMFVDMGPDRLHHGFWKFWDRSHIRYVPGNPFEHALEDYYEFLDRQLGSFLEKVPPYAHVFVVSDHGAKRMDGGICINEWLRKEGYLKLKSLPTEVGPLISSQVDWPRTQVWGEGGYYSRIMLNVAGREPQGCVSQSEYEPLRDELIAKLEALGDDQGRPIGTRVYKPENLYPHVQGIPPDLIALFGNLHWRSVGTIGWPTLWADENDTGPDDANHSQHGVFVAHNIPGLTGELEGLHLTQMAGTILSLLGQPLPADLEAPPIIEF